MKINVRVMLYIIAFGLLFILWNKWQIASREHYLSQEQTQQESLPENIQEGNSGSQKVRIKTDVYDVYIDTKGAGIIAANLLQYPTSLQDEKPLSLIRSDNPNRMQMLSGIAHGDNTNAPSHLANWTVDKEFYHLKDGEDKLIVPFYWTDAEGVTSVKTFTFKRNSYEIEISQKVHNESGSDWVGRAYNQIAFGKPQGGGLSSAATFTGAAISTEQKRYEKIKLDDLESINPASKKANKYQKDIAGKDGWVAMIQHYFIAAFVPESGKEQRIFTNYNQNTGDHIVGVKTELFTVENGADYEFAGKAYIGPKIVKNLEKTAPYLDKAVDYGWLFIISEFMFKVMDLIYSLLGNWGWSIVVITLMIKGLFFMPSAWAYKSMAKMRLLQPELNRLRERYGEDRQKMAQEQMKLFRREQVNPMSGCLPMLLQIPFFIAFYYMLAESVELRQSAWIFWIKDLSVMDPYFVLPIINTALMFVQQKLNPPPPDPMMQKMMLMMPLIFGMMFAVFPSGLVLYWTVSNAFGIVQQYLMNKHYGESKLQKKMPKAAND
ncbi:MAG: membrane protein insertase YidC [Cardiobacteriaceae bacterium]|nr:membrane protein insertase YidC [Cardiobacteriaceae bacterium]